MSVSALALVGLLAWQCPVPGAVRRFPHDFTPQQGDRLRRQAQQSWPGPSGLLETWQTGGLNENQKVALLISAAGFHDQKLLPIYIEAVGSSSPRLRMAAVYGYRTLLGDLPPPTYTTISDEHAQAAATEMQQMQVTLRRHPLVTMWLASALHSEGNQWPDWSGVLLARPPIACFQAIERIVEAEDLSLLITAYPLFGRQPNRIPLLRLIEGLSMSRFVTKPASGKVWGPEIYERGEQLLQRWLEQRCQRSDDELLQERFAAMGAADVDPFAVEACSRWQDILVQGDPSWWLLASRQLYRCGAPPLVMSILRAESDNNRQTRGHLLSWYRLGRNKSTQPDRRRSRPRPPTQ